MDTTEDILTLELLTGWQRATEVLADGDHRTRVCALCVMAVLVARMPVGDIRDMLEDRISAHMAATELTADDLATIRHFRGIDAGLVIPR